MDILTLDLNVSFITWLQFKLPLTFRILVVSGQPFQGPVVTSAFTAATKSHRGAVVNIESAKNTNFMHGQVIGAFKFRRRSEKQNLKKYNVCASDIAKWGTVLFISVPITRRLKG